MKKDLTAKLTELSHLRDDNSLTGAILDYWTAMNSYQLYHPTKPNDQCEDYVLGFIEAEYRLVYGVK